MRNDLTRDASLQRLIDLVDKGLLARPRSTETFQASRKVLDALKRKPGSASAVAAKRLPVCSELPASLAQALAASSPLPELAVAFAAVEPRLSWGRRSTADPSDSRYYNGHANATIIGKGGLEEREDVWFGVTVMAPRVQYQLHNHPPEEVYFVLTAGEWWNAGMDWTEPGPGGTIYNPPGIDHAMRSGDKPMLAFWLLPILA